MSEHVAPFRYELARWAEITGIFNAALEKPQGERKRFVHEACAHDSEMEAEVNRLLAADDEAGSFLERPAIGGLISQTALKETPSLHPGA